MPLRTRKYPVAVAIAATVAATSLAVLAAQSRSAEVSGDWPMYSHSLSGQRYSPLTEISTANVASLAPAWTVRLTQPAGRRGGGPPPAPSGTAEAGRRGGGGAPAAGAPGAAANPAAPNPEAAAAGSNPQATPIVVAGVMYLPARGNQVLALEADTGKEIWRQTLPPYATTTARGVAYWPGDGQTPARIQIGRASCRERVSKQV